MRKGGVIDANLYKMSESAIRDLSKGNQYSDLSEAVGHISVATQVPIIAVVAIVNKMYGGSGALDKLLHRLMNFYLIETVIIGTERIEHAL